MRAFLVLGRLLCATCCLTAVGCSLAVKFPSTSLDMCLFASASWILRGGEVRTFAVRSIRTELLMGGHENSAKGTIGKFALRWRPSVSSVELLQGVLRFLISASGTSADETLELVLPVAGVACSSAFPCEDLSNTSVLCDACGLASRVPPALVCTLCVFSVVASCTPAIQSLFGLAVFLRCDASP